MGSFSPKRVVTVNADATPPAPYKLVDNVNCLLDKTDLVFVDPVGTGFSHAVGKAQDKDFWGIDQDMKSLAQFINTYVSRNNRWNSPKFLIGESYGTFRSAALSNYLQSHDGMDFNGIVLISSVLDLGTISFNPGEDMPYVFYLPSYAATAWYHKMLKDRPDNLPAFIEEARNFAQTAYLSALVKGSKLGAAEKSEVAKQLSRYTGLSEDYLIKADLRVNLPQFMKELQRSRGLTTGRLDARFSGFSYDLLGEYAEYDPQDTSITGPFTAAFNTYVREELKFGQDKVYHTGSDEAGNNWDWKHHSGDNFGFPGSPNVEGDLIQAMLTNPHLQIEVENGLVRFGHAVLRHGIYDGTSGPSGKATEKYPSAVLRRGPHDVSARRGSCQAQSEHRELYRQRFQIASIAIKSPPAYRQAGIGRWCLRKRTGCAFERRCVVQPCSWLLRY